jgi:coproporphyrinogen III oxidase-like Fe-S oxidoreductase
MGDHASAYQLTIEPNTVFAGRFRRGELVMPDDEVQASLFEITRDLLTASGRPAYEVSNHAKPGQECRHNLVYWRYGDYVGVGPGAHGRLTLDGGRFGTRTHRAPEIWLERVRAHGHGEHEREPIAPLDQVAEALMMGLRLAEGVPHTRLVQCAGRPVGEIIDHRAVADLTAGGFLKPSTDRLIATDAGFAVLDSVLSRLLA